MEEHIVKILEVEEVTHDVRRFTVEKPAGYKFTPGQATEAAINKPELKNENRPFTFTGLNEWKDLEFTIKGREFLLPAVQALLLLSPYLDRFKKIISLEETG